MLNGLVNITSKVLRTTGQGLDKIGKAIECNGYTERLNPSLRAFKVKKSTPEIEGTFVSSTSAVLGDVSIGAKSQVWYGAIVRGDIGAVSIGEKVTVGDRAIVRCSNVLKKNPITIGNAVLIGANSTIDSCTIEDHCCVGEGAVVNEGAKMQQKSMLAAGSVLPAGAVVKTGEVWGGSPAKFLRNILPSELENNEVMSCPLFKSLSIMSRKFLNL